MTGAYEQINENVRRQYSKLYGPYQAGDYDIGQTVRSGNLSGDVLWSCNSDNGFTYVVDFHDGLPGEILASQIQEIQEIVSIPECFMRENTALFRHYHINQVIICIHQFTGITMAREEAIELVQKLRDEFMLGPIFEHNLIEEREEE